MALNRYRLFFVAIIVASGIVVFRPVVLGLGRYFSVRRFTNVPGVLECLAVEPINRKLTTSTIVHLANLGYATFDTGSSIPFSCETGSSGVAIVLDNADVHLLFLPPRSAKITDSMIKAAKISSSEATAHPHTLAFLQMMETDYLAAQIKAEETHLLPLAKLLFMSGDDFLLYSTMIGQKGGFECGASEVQFFESPAAKGLVRIGKSTKDRHVAVVFLNSTDGTRELVFYLTLASTSLKQMTEVLDPILSSFHFTADRVDDRDRIKAMIRDAGIKQKTEANQSLHQTGRMCFFPWVRSGRPAGEFRR